MSRLEVEGLEVSYAGRQGSVTALADFSLVVPEGRLTVLLGESGCGKSTALNAIAGLTRPAFGRIALGGETLFESTGRGGVSVPPNRRDIGMVFQSYALWPHLTVLDNVMYPLRRRRIDRTAATRAAHGALATVRCDPLAQRYPGELSGGQQQRVALARALAAQPKMLLFDEPLSNLDAGLRRGLREELARLHRELGFTAVYVTHDQSEALSLGTDIAVMDGGRIIQSGTPAEVYRQPGTEFVARFFGANVIPGRVVMRTGPLGTVETPAGTIAAATLPAGDQVNVAFLPQAVAMEASADGPLAVAAAMYVGTHREVRLENPQVEVLAIQPANESPPALGTRMRITVAPEEVQVYAAAPRRVGEGPVPA